MEETLAPAEVVASPTLDRATIAQPTRYVESASDTLSNRFRATNNEKQRINQVETATWLRQNESGFLEFGGRKATAFSDSWDSTWASRGIDYFKYDRNFWREEDDVFVKEVKDEEFLLEYIKSRGLDLSSFKTLDEAKNAEHLTDLADLEVRKRDVAKNQSNALTDAETMFSLVTNFADIDIVIGGAFGTVAKMARKMEGANKILSAGAGATHLGYGSFMATTQEDISWGEAMLFSAVGGAIDGAVVKHLGRDAIHDVSSGLKGMPSDDIADSLARREAIIQEKLDAKLGAEFSPTLKNQKMSEMLDEMDMPKPNEEKIIKLQREIDELDNIGKPKKSQAEINKREKARVELLKSEISKKLKHKSSNGFKQIEDRVARLDPNKKYADLPDTKQIQIDNLRQQQEDMFTVGEMLGDDINAIKKDLDALYGANPEVFTDEMLEMYMVLNKSGKLSKNGISQLNDFVSSGGKKGKKPKIEVKDNGLDKDMDIKINGKKVGKAPYILGVGLIGTSAFAYDGQDALNDTGLYILAGLGLLGVGANAGNIINATKRLVRTKKSAEVLDQTRSKRAWLAKQAQKTRTRITETLEPLKKGANEEFNKLVDDIYFNPVEGSATVERRKNQIFHTAFLPLQQKTHELYRQWLKDTGTGRVESVLSLFRSQSKRSEYNRLISENIEYGLHSDVDSVVKGAKEVNNTLDDMVKQMKEAGIKDIDKTHLIQNYLPRVTRKNNIANLMLGLNPSSKEQFIKSFAGMMTKTPEAEDVARVYLDSITNVKSGSSTVSSMDDIKKILKDGGLDESLADDLADVLGVGGDKFRRLKNRIFMDKIKFQPADLRMADGTPVKISVDDIFENDVMSVMGDYLNSASGHLGFADLGYKSIDDAMELAAKNAPNVKAREEVINDINLLAGNPILDYSDTANVIWRNIGNFAMSKAMVFSTISLLQETATTAAKMNGAGWRTALSGLANSFRKGYGDDSLLVSQMQELTGLGMHQYSKTFGAYKTIDDVGNVAGGESALGAFSKSSEIARDFTLHVLPFVRGSDYLTSVNLVDTAQFLLDIRKGKTIVKDFEKVTYGIDDDLMRVVDKFEYNSKGKVKSVDFSTWSRKDRVKLSTAVDLIMQKRIQQATMGTTATFTRQSALGAMTSVLIKFPMSAYANHGSFLGRGIFAGDAQSMIQTALWFGAGGVASTIRHEIKGQDYEMSDFMMESMLSHPFAGAYGTVLGNLKPAPTQMASDLSDNINMYGWTH